MRLGAIPEPQRDPNPKRSCWERIWGVFKGCEVGEGGTHGQEGVPGVLQHPALRDGVRHFVLRGGEGGERGASCSAVLSSASPFFLGKWGFHAAGPKKTALGAPKKLHFVLQGVETPPPVTKRRRPGGDVSPRAPFSSPKCFGCSRRL